jgi:ribulose-phosphate 3-epimerase
MVKIAPSLLSADFSRLKEELAEVEAAGADWIHVDVMDGHFVPNLTIGPLVVEAIRPHTRLPLDVHLMIEDPDRYIPAFAKSGADWITIHQEACPHLHRSVSLIAEQGVKAGVAVNPATPVSLLEPILPYIDLVLIMTVNPGFGGQKLIPTALKKVEQVRRMLEELGRTDVEIEVDGGIHPGNAGEATALGTTVLVAGSAVFGAPDRREAIAAIRSAAEAGTSAARPSG